MRVSRLALSLLVLSASSAGAQPGPPPYDEGGVGLGLALRRLGVTARVLYVTAHPDDENNAVLVRLSRGEGVRTALLTLTRGEGGQNAVGPELGPALGVLRSEELMETHRYDGVEQYFGRAYEFGFSFSVEESFQKWGREETLGDVVRVVRAFRPDVIVTLPLEAAGGGQHHQAAAQLARDAFRAAADPGRFPEQRAAGLRPWQARALYRSGVGGGDNPTDAAAAQVPIAVFDPLLGMTWTELGGLARRAHRSQDQGFGRGPTTAPPARFVLVDSEPALPSTHGLLDGVDPTLPGLLRFVADRETPAARALAAKLEELQIGVGKAQAVFDVRSPERTGHWLQVILRILRDLPRDLPPEGRDELLDRLADEQRDVEQALGLALGVRLTALTRDDAVVPGQTFDVDVSLGNEGREPLRLGTLDLDVPPGWSATPYEDALAQVAPGAEARRSFKVTVAPDAPASGPYWHKAPDRDRVLLDRAEAETLPWSPPPIVARAQWGADDVVSTAPARWLGPRSPGIEKRKEPAVVPALGVRLSPSVAVVPLGRRAPRAYKATVTDYTKDGGPASVRLVAPEGWTVSPASREIAFRYEGETVDAWFDVTPPARLAAGSATLRAVVSRAGRDYGEGVQVISYEHVPDRQLVQEAVATLVATDVKAAGHARIGYVMGSGDGVAEALDQLGFPVTLLDAKDLGSDLKRFSTIVTGIRAFEVRADLRAQAAKLLQFARDGGHVVVQYNRTGFNFAGPPPRGTRDTPVASPYAPYPASVGSRRVTDETAAMRLLVPDHPIFTRPNRIGPQDWEGWVQERAIQALDTNDQRYRDLLTARDPFPQNPDEQKGLLVEATVGRGSWTYVALVLFRQVAAGTPGAYRLLANLASRPRQ
ncbi:MAG TPA: PIG-L family deacetylase [Vicinamibacteria bacterium]|nr:PIG-L family deacetylase [Vicinamibacteria bacterium]